MFVVHGRNFGPRDAADENGAMRLRVRQNVVLELGYLMGSLGRKRVTALLVEQLEQPSDLRGLAYHRYDKDGGWKLKLAKELQAAGIAVDFSKIT